MSGDKSSKAVSEANPENKPMVVIDCLASPYQVIEPSPKEIIDIYSDEEECPIGGLNQGLEAKLNMNKKKKQKQQKTLQVDFF